jgi:tape measure domain-containing protein
MREGVRRIQQSFEQAEDASKKFALALVAGGGGLIVFGGWALKAAGDMEQTKVAFTTMLGSAEKADSFIKQMVQFAAQTPFELKGLSNSAKMLLAYGSAQEEVIPQLKMLGDIAAGVGNDKLPNLILAFGQVHAATRLTGTELRQFTEAGVPLLDTLAKQFNVTVSEMSKMISGGKVGFNDVQIALQSLTGEGGRFHNLMENQSHTLLGMVSNLKDAWNIFLTGEGQKLLEWGKQFVAWGVYVVQNVLPQLVEKISQTTQFFSQHKEVLIIVAGAVIGALIPSIYAAVVAFAALAVSLAPFIIGGAIIGAIVAGIYYLITHWDKVKEFFGQVWEKIKSVMQSIKNAWQEGVEYLKDVAYNVFDAIKSKIETVTNWITAQINKVKDAFNAVKGFVGNIGNSIAGVFGGGKASGGSVAAGVPYLVGEEGAEIFVPSTSGRIIPNNKISEGGMRSQTINVHLQGSFFTSDDVADRWAKRLGDKIRLQLKV